MVLMAADSHRFYRQFWGQTPGNRVFPIWNRDGLRWEQRYELRGEVVATSMMGLGSWRMVRTNTWTMAPSNWALAQRSSSASASRELRPFLYVRSLVMVS